MNKTNKIIVVLFIFIYIITNTSYSQNLPYLTLVHDDGYDSINSLSFSSDSTKLITCVSRGIVWDASTGKILQTINSSGIGCAAFSFDNNMIIGGRSHLLTRIWDIKNGTLLYSRQIPINSNSYDNPLSIFGVSFLPNLKEAIIIDQYGKVEKWNYKDNETHEIVNIEIFPFQEIIVSNDGNLIFVNPYIISIPERRIIHIFEHSTAFNFNKKTVFSLRVNGGSYQIYNLEEYDTNTYKKIREYPSFIHYGRLARLHPEGHYVIAGRTGVRDEETQIIDAHTARVCKTFQNEKGKDEIIDKIVFSPNGKQVALVSGNRIKLYNLSDLTSVVKEAEALGR